MFNNTNTNHTNLYSYIPMASPQFPWLLSRIRNAWIALITPPNKLFVQVLNETSDKLEENILKANENAAKLNSTFEEAIAKYKLPDLSTNNLKVLDSKSNKD